MKYVLNRFIGVFIVIPFLFIYLIVGYASLHFIIHWIITGNGFKEHWESVRDYLLDKIPSRKEDE